MTRSTRRFNRHRIRASLHFFLSGPYLREALSIDRLLDPQRDGHTRKTRTFGVQGNPQVVSDNDRYTYFTYPHTARSWLGCVKQSYSAYRTTCICML